MSTAKFPGLLVEAKNIYGLPERDVEKIHVPGRNGDVLIDYGSYQNMTARTTKTAGAKTTSLQQGEK